MTPTVHRCRCGTWIRADEDECRSCAYVVSEGDIEGMTPDEIVAFLEEIANGN